MSNRNLLKKLQDSVYVVEENGKKVNNNEFNRIVAPIYSQKNVNTPIAPSPIITDNYSYDDMSIDELRNRYSDLTKQLANYKRTEKTGLWDKDKNVIDNIGNALYKLILEGDDKYVEDETYNKLNREYKAVSKALDNKSIEQYGNNMSVIDKVPYTIVGNLRTSTNGIESTVKKILGQTPETKELSYEEKMAQLASEQSSGLGKVGLDVLGSVSRMIPQMAVGDPKAALAMGFANYGGSAYNEAKQMGASENSATAYGLTIGALETGLEKVLGGLESVYGKSVLGKTTDKIMNKVITNSAFRNVLTNMSGEFTEEYLQEFLEPIVKNVILEEKNGADFWNAQDLESGVKQLASQLFNQQNLYAGALGAITSGITNAPKSLKVNSEIKNIKGNINQNNVGEHLNQLISKGYDVDTSLDIINGALEETGQATISDDIQKQIKKEIKDSFKQNTSNLPINSTVEQQSNNSNINNQIQDNNQNNTVKMQNNAILENNNKQTIVEDSKSFAEQVDDVLNNKYSEKNMLVVSKDTPKILQEIGLSNLPITMTQRHLKTIMNSSGKYQGANYHDLGVDLVKQLPEAINNPLNILQSDTKSDSIVIITELADKQNRPIIASIKIDGTGRVNDIEFDSNVMTSAYGRNNYDEFMKRNISKGNLLYDIDEGIIKRISGKLQLQPTDSERETHSRLQLPKGDNSSSKQIAPIKEQFVSNNDNTTNSTKSQIAPLPSQNNMQQVEKNIPVAKEKNTIAETKQNIAPVKIDEKINLPKNPTKESSYDDVNIKDKEIQFTRKAKIAEYRELASDYLSNTMNWKDIPLIKQKVNTMKRNLRMIMSQVEADAIYNEYFAPISENNAIIEREITKYNKKIESLNLKEKEAVAVQMLGELKYNPDTNLTSMVVNKYIQNEHINKQKIDNAIEVFRSTYDELFNRVNETLKEQGYKEIEYRKGYFPHFTEEHGKTIIGKMAEKLGWKFNGNKLPTDIAGITDQFKPGKKWTTFSQQRTGDFTEYNALKGFDNYIRGAMQIIHHTEDIQKLRGLENQIRYQHSEKGLQEKIDNIMNDENITSEEKQDRIDLTFKDYNNQLANFVTNLRDYTNNLAGKKSILDRSSEQLIGRNIYNVMDNVSSRVSANMVGANLSSAITNFIPITQAWSQVSTKNMLKAMTHTIVDCVKTDNFVEKSDYLTSRINQADRLYKTKLEKISDTAGKMFEAIDNFTSQTIVRGKYLQNIEKGMNQQQALNNANEFAKDVMAGRSQGDMPTIFNSKSPITKLFTAFQLEVNNQYGYMFHDLPHDLKDEAITNLTMAFFKMFFGAWLYNKAKDSLGIPSGGAFSPFDIAKETVKIATNDDLSTYNKVSNVSKNIAQELPFIGGLLGGGRLPISAALPDLGTTVESITNLNNSEKSEQAIKNLEKELSKPFYYVLLPFGGGQLKKSIDGLSMYDKNLPVAGSYTDSGNLRFTADESVGGKVKAALFGQYSSKEADEYIASNYKTINANKIDEMKQLNMTSSEYRKYRQGLTAARKTTDDNGYTKYKDNSNNTYWYDKENKIVYDDDYNIANKSISSLTKASKKEQVFDYINSLDMSIAQKNKILNAEYGGETTDSYGNVKYTREEEVYNNGLKKYENTKGTTYWVNTKTGYVYNTSGKLAKNYGTLSPVKEEKTYWYDRENKKLYDSKYNTVDTNILSSLTKEKKVIDISDYNKYNSFDEYEYASNNPDKYAIIKQITSYDKYNQYNKKIKDIKDNSINDKNEVIKYVNSLDLSIPQKAMFIKTYYKSFKTYDKQIVEYVNNQKLSMTEKTKILTELGFKMQNGIVVY